MEWRTQCVASISSSRRFSKYTAKHHPSKTTICTNLGVCNELACRLCVVAVHIYSPFWWLACRFNRCCYSFVVWWIGHLLRHDCEPLFQIQKVTQDIHKCRYFCILLDACRTGKSRVLHRFPMGRDRLCTC